MKKIVCLLFVMAIAVGGFAQAGAAEKTAGNAAYKAKNYAEAFNKFEAYLKAVNFKDDAYLYNAATVAYKAKKYPEAEKYYGMAIKARYKLASSYKGLAVTQKAQKKEAEYVATLDAAMKAVPSNADLEKMYALHYLKLGADAQKAGKEAVATTNFQKIADMSNKSYKVQGYNCLASLYFNTGAKIMQDVTPFANSDKAKYEDGKSKANAQFQKAKTYCEQAKSLDPANAEVKTMLTNIANAMK